MYRLNCNLADDIAKRMNDYAERTGVSRVNIVSLALDQYLAEQELKRKLMEELSDPMNMAQIYKILGMSSEVKLESSDDKSADK